jgi:hypothetical protein
MEEELKRLKEEAELVGLPININKTKGMRADIYNMQKFRLGKTEIEEVGPLVYLGSVVSENGVTEEDVASRIKKANGVFFSPVSCVWKILVASLICIYVSFFTKEYHPVDLTDFKLGAC